MGAEISNTSSSVEYGNLNNYATLNFCGVQTNDVIVQMLFCVCDDGYAGCSVDFQQALVKPHYFDKLRQNTHVWRMITQEGSYGGRGSHPAGIHGEERRDRFIQQVERIFLIALAENLASLFAQNISVTLDTIGAHPIKRTYTFIWAPQVKMVVG